MHIQNNAITPATSQYYNSYYLGRKRTNVDGWLSSDASPRGPVFFRCSYFFTILGPITLL